MSTTSADLPTETLGVVAHGAGDLRVESVPLRRPAASEAVVEIAYGGVCGSDLHYWTHGAAGESILRAPMLLGHEVAGTVLRQADDGTGPAAGTRVTVHPATPGGNVPRYPAGRPNLFSGCTYLGSAAQFPPHRRGLHPICRIARADVAGSARRPAAAHCCRGRTGGGRLACRSPRRRHRRSQRAGRGQRTNRCPRRVSAATRRR